MYLATLATFRASVAPVSGLICLINTLADEPFEVLPRWQLELRERGLAAMVKASHSVPVTCQWVFRPLLGQALPGNSAPRSPMREVKPNTEELTVQPMRIFAFSNSSYF